MNRDPSFFRDPSNLSVNEASFKTEKSMFEEEAKYYFLRYLDPSYYNKIDFEYLRKLEDEYQTRSEDEDEDVSENPNPALQNESDLIRRLTNLKINFSRLIKKHQEIGGINISRKEYRLILTHSYSKKIRNLINEAVEHNICDQWAAREYLSENDPFDLPSLTEFVARFPN